MFDLGQSLLSVIYCQSCHGHAVPRAVRAGRAHGCPGGGGGAGAAGQAARPRPPPRPAAQLLGARQLRRGHGGHPTLPCGRGRLRPRGPEGAHHGGPAAAGAASGGRGVPVRVQQRVLTGGCGLLEQHVLLAAAGGAAQHLPPVRDEDRWSRHPLPAREAAAGARQEGGAAAAGARLARLLRGVP